MLLPVLDDSKHYWVGADEIDKLLRRGAGWLPEHPHRELISRRYLRRQGHLAREALARLATDAQDDPDAADQRHDRAEDHLEAGLGLGQRRIDAAVRALADSGATRVLDLGCGEGRLLAALLADGTFTELVGVDVSHGALQRAARRLRLDEMSPAQRRRIDLVHSSLTYRDKRLGARRDGATAAAALEVVEHLEPDRLPAFQRVLFGQLQPGTIVLTTPNAEYNPRFPGLASGQFRNPDHRFEWARAGFARWAQHTAERHGYAVRFVPVGPEDPEVGSPTQLAVFRR